MKKIFLLALICIYYSGILLAQDIIFLKTGLEVKSKVLEITQSEIKYKKFDNLDGPTISVSKAEVVMIRYQNGTNEIISSNQTKQETQTSKPESRINSKPFRIGFYAQPLGFVEFGPIVGTEMTIANHLILEGHLRFATYGLLSYVAANNADEGLPDKLTGTAFGGAVKFLAPSRIGGFYVGPVIEYGKQNQTFAQDETYAWESKATYVAAMITVGYKFRFHSGFYMNTGMYLGAYHTLSDKSHNLKNNINIYHNNDLKTLPSAMLEVSLGVEF
jgi:hypothetical protein